MLVRLSLVILLCVIPIRAQERQVALTFDDLPAAGTVNPSEMRAVNQRILSALRNHRAPAVGFVNAGKLPGQESSAPDASILEEWVRQKHALGNHTASHIDLNRVSVEEFEKDALSGEEPLAEVLKRAGKRLEYFRFPFNHTGDTKEKHDAVAAFLAQHGYRLAPCTIDNSDYLFDHAYAIAVSRQDQESMARIRSEYLAYTSVEIDYYSQLHRQVFGHEIPHVMLLHVNQLNADTIDETMKIFEGKGYRFVTLKSALSDPVYSIPDSFVTAYGWMWGYRWARERHIKVDGSAEREPPTWISSYGNN